VLHLEIGCDAELPEAWIQLIHKGKGCFPNLRHVTIRICGKLLSCDNFLMGVVNSVETVTISGLLDEPPISRSEITPFFEKINSLGFAHLKAITLCRVTFLDEKSVPSNLFVPLFACRVLECFEWTEAFDLGYCLHNDDITQMAQHWKALTSFTIRAFEMPDENSTPSLSFSSVTTLLEHCQHLRHIVLSVEIGENDLHSSNSSYPHRTYRLESLDLQNSLLLATKTKDLALWLYDHCPFRSNPSAQAAPRGWTRSPFCTVWDMQELLLLRTQTVEGFWRRENEELRAENSRGDGRE
jgi:hypothetical protein